MSVNFAHWHLFLNHLPIVGTVLGLALLLFSSWDKGNGDLRRASLILFVVSGFLAIPAFLTGFAARLMLTGTPGISDTLIQRHEGSAMLSIWFVELTGALASLELWEMRFSRRKRLAISAVTFASLITMGLMIRTGNTGGDIRHLEIHTSRTEVVSEGLPGRLLKAIEPTPDKLSLFIVDNRWLWGFLMAAHFLGLAVIIGTVGVLDLRILGFMKQLPGAALHGFVPWTMAGLGMNVVTGLLAFMGQPETYISSATFWLKMLALLLIGLNAAAFYFTGTFERVQVLEAGEDAPRGAKLIAGSALLLWFAIIMFGRYIQPLENTIRIGSN